MFKRIQRIELTMQNPTSYNGNKQCIYHDIDEHFWNSKHRLRIPLQPQTR